VIELVGDQEVQALDVMGRLARLAPVDPSALVELVALPRLAGGKPHEQGDQGGEQRKVVGDHGNASGTGRRGVDSSWTANTRSTSERAAPRPPACGLTQCATRRTASTASAGQVASPTCVSTGTSSTSSPM